MPLASPDIKNAAKFATSSGSISLFIKQVSLISLNFSLKVFPSACAKTWISSILDCVFTQPGQIELTVIPFSPNSSAQHLANPLTPCLAALYGPNPARPLSPNCDEILIILPGVVIFEYKPFVRKYKPAKFKLIISSQTSFSNSSILSSFHAPALLINPYNGLFHCAVKFLTASLSEISKTK